MMYDYNVTLSVSGHILCWPAADRHFSRMCFRSHTASRNHQSTHTHTHTTLFPLFFLLFAASRLLKVFRAYAHRVINRPLYNILIPSSTWLHQWITCKFKQLNAVRAAKSGFTGHAEARLSAGVERAVSPWLSPSPLHPLTCLLTLLLRLHFLNFTRLCACTRRQQRVLVGVFLELRQINYKCGAHVFSSVAEKVSRAKTRSFSPAWTIPPLNTHTKSL